MKKLKFLFTASRAEHIENFHLPAIDALRGRGHIVDVAAEGTVSPEHCDNSYDMTFRKKIYSPKNFNTIRKISRLIRKENYDVVISNTTLASVMTRLALSMLSKKRPYHIYICHGYLFKDDSSKKSKLYRKIESATSAYVDLLLTMNNEDYELAQKYRLCRDIRTVNGMGLDAERFPVLDRGKIDSFRSSIGADKDDFLFLCVGEFSARKNQALIINAFSDYISKYPKSLLLFAGTGELLDEAKRLAEYKEISHRVRFLGHTYDINTAYRASQAVVSASRSEGLPFNIMEALECNVPVIASDVKGHSDLIRSGFNGFLFRDNDERSLLENMIKITDRDNYEAVRRNTYLDDKYKSDNVTDSLIEYYLGKFSEEPASAANLIGG